MKTRGKKNVESVLYGYANHNTPLNDGQRIIVLENGHYTATHAPAMDKYS